MTSIIIPELVLKTLYNAGGDLIIKFGVNNSQEVDSIFIEKPELKVKEDFALDITNKKVYIYGVPYILTPRQFDAISIIYKSNYTLPVEEFCIQYFSIKMNDRRLFNTKIGATLSMFNSSFRKKHIPMSLYRQSSNIFLDWQKPKYIADKIKRDNIIMEVSNDKR